MPSSSTHLFYLHSFPTRRSSDLIFLPPDFSAASLIAFCSTFVIFVGQQINIRGFEKKPLTFILSIKYFNIASVTSKSAITPSFKGRSEEHTSELQSRGHLVCLLRPLTSSISTLSLHDALPI